MICDVCKNGIPVGVASSALGPMSFAYCGECLANHAEPYWLIEHTIISCGGWSQVWEGFGETFTFFKDGAYHPAREIIVTDEKIKAFWDEYNAYCER
jgi:hypothetical protein